MTMSFYSKFQLNIMYIVSVHKQVQVHRFSLYIVLLVHYIIIVHGIELSRQITYEYLYTFYGFMPVQCEEY